MLPVSRWSMLVLAACVAVPAMAQTLYKLVDRQGKVTYVQELPKDFDGTVTRIDTDNKVNTVAPIRTPPPAAPASPPAAAKAPAAPASRSPTPQARLEQARKALEEARDNPGPDDVRRVGNVGGGTRPVPTEAYQQRLAELERAVREAEEEVRRASR